jgi:hypothetical protein
MRITTWLARHEQRSLSRGLYESNAQCGIFTGEISRRLWQRALKDKRGDMAEKTTIEFCLSWRQLFGNDGFWEIRRVRTGSVFFGPGEVVPLAEEAVEAWVGDSPRLLCRPAAAMAALAQFHNGCTFDDVRAALARTNALVA